jgi:hypothetical protein
MIMSSTPTIIGTHGAIATTAHIRAYCQSAADLAPIIAELPA